MEDQMTEPGTTAFEFNAGTEYTTTPMPHQTGEKVFVGDRLQRTEEWYAQRLGKLTGSKIYTILPGARGAYKEAREQYAYTLVAERLTGKRQEIYTSSAMEWGIIQEDNAKTRYTEKTGIEVIEAGFFEHPMVKMTGASPDGLINHEGILEIKCPETHNHLKTMAKGEIKPEYEAQIQWQLACTNRLYCDFVSFDPRVAEPYDIYIKRIERDDVMIATLQKEAVIFLDYVDMIIESLNIHE